MWTVILKVLWQGIKTAWIMSMAIGYMRAAVALGATPLEAGCATVASAVVIAAYFVAKVAEDVLHTFHPKVDELVADVGIIRSQHV